MNEPFELKKLSTNGSHQAKPFMVKLTDKGCWETISHVKDKLGYGYIQRNRKVSKAHRFAYEIMVGEIPQGMCVLHHCDNPPCVNPKHLFVGTHADNMRDMIIKGRNKGAIGERNSGSKLTDKDVRSIRKLRGFSTLRGIASLYNVHLDTIDRIVNNRTWSHVEN